MAIKLFEIKYFLTLSFIICLFSLASSALAQTLNSGIKGSVVLAPGCPPIRQPSLCKSKVKPFQGTLLVLKKGALKGLTVTPDKDGHFRISLGSGVYVVRPIQPRPGIPPFGKEKIVNVKEGAFTEVTIRYDTGIR